MRGTPDLHGKLSDHLGIIPAYAGNTSNSLSARRSVGDHPRVCGEHDPPVNGSDSFVGSSPRMRGTRIPGVLRSRRSGIIPAYAGNTRRKILEFVYSGDHPRVCGEHVVPNGYDLGKPGSSPRMRGTRDTPECGIAGTGIIPAYAGNTMVWRSTSTSIRDHPRVCGEHLTLLKHVLHGEGSSPRMRGTPGFPRHRHTWRGIIPAYAGNTLPRWHTHSVIWDHPRVCGEHPLGAVNAVGGAGSSPRMRGTPQSRNRRDHPPGIIPAYAGNTYTPYQCGTGDRDHPRVCGEHWFIVYLISLVSGSSPRMRGTR